MECHNIQDLLIAYLENNLNEEQKMCVEEHLTECERCRNEYKISQQLLTDMDKVADEQPGPDLQLSFNQMLEEEKETQRYNKFKPVSTKRKIEFGNFREFLKYAAVVIIIFGIGILLGKNLGEKGSHSVEIVQLKTELQMMQQNLTLATLKQPTTSQRLKAVNILDEQVQADEKIVAILVQTLQSDENVNVRMAAANALAKYTNNELVTNAFLEALRNQKEPSLQITLINILVKIQDERARILFQDIMKNENTLPVVKQLASEGIKVFV